MSSWPAQPVIYEVFTWPWLRAIAARARRAVTLATVPDEEWNRLRLPGIEAVWLMGVWERSEAGRRVALADPSFRAATAATLTDAVDDDVLGSAYCVRDYRVDERLGGDAGLAAAREALAARGLRLVLDFVPNHVAPDHQWVTAHPEYFVRGDEEDATREPEAWLATDGGVLARGRDPYFPPWPDVVQLDPMAASHRDAVVETLVRIGSQCDGVRCDMAMLLLDEVAERTWGARLEPPQPRGYWSEVTTRVRAVHPDLLFLAEAYWDLEERLFAEGIDLCYDKRLYDCLAHEGAAAVRGHLQADAAWQRRLVRFLENHDEPRAAATFPPDRLRAAAVVQMTIPGAPLLYHGQLEGHRIRPPVHLGREPDEPDDAELAAFWHRLLQTVHDERVRTGRWQLLDVEGWVDNRSNEQLLAWRWDGHVIVVNYGSGTADGLVRLGPDLHGSRWTFVDLLAGEAYERDGDDVAEHGLYVRLGEYGAHLFRLERRGSSG